MLKESFLMDKERKKQKKSKTYDTKQKLDLSFGMLSPQSIIKITIAIVLY